MAVHNAGGNHIDVRRSQQPGRCWPCRRYGRGGGRSAELSFLTGAYVKSVAANGTITLQLADGTEDTRPFSGVLDRRTGLTCGSGIRRQ